MARRKMLDTNGAVAEALRLARLQVFAANPPCPGEPVAACLASYAAEGKLAVKFMPVDSEQTALICAVGALLSGIRASTSTSSMGLGQLHEACGVASMLRAPLVMPVLNRPVMDPRVHWGNFQDAMSERDGGWLQFYAADCQEILDLLLMAFRIAEDEQIRLPAMVCLDGYFLAQSTEAVDVPTGDEADSFLPRFALSSGPDSFLHANGHTTVFPLDEYSEIRYWQSLAFKAAEKVIPKAMAEFAAISGRTYCRVDAYRADDAQAVLVVMGSVAGTVKYVVDRYREAGLRVGMLKVVSFRPFPSVEVAELLGGAELVAVLDRSPGLGGVSGPLCSDVRAAVANYGSGLKVSSFLAGLGGREISLATIAMAFDSLLDGELALESKWVDVDAESVMSLQHSY